MKRNATKKAPICGNRIGAKQDNPTNHPVPIITRSPRRHKRRVRFRLTPANVALLFILIAALALAVVGVLNADAVRDLISLSDELTGVIG